MLPEKSSTPKKDVLILELTDRSNSGFVMEGTEKTGDPVHLNGPGFRRIIPTSHVMWNFGTAEKPEYAPRKIRHIVGAPSIFVDEQDKAGYKFEFKRDDSIYFKGTDGIMTVIRQGRDINKYDYLKACEFNFHATADRNDENELPAGKFGRDNVQFRELRSEEIATTDVSSLTWQRNALEIVTSLYTETGEDEYSYDLDRMNVIASVVGIGPKDSASELLIAINEKAQSDPKSFVMSVANRTVEIRAQVSQAFQLGLLSIADGQVILKSNGQAIVKTDAKQRKSQVQVVSQFMLTPDGSLVYTNLIAELEKERELLGSKNPALA